MTGKRKKVTEDTVETPEVTSEAEEAVGLFGVTVSINGETHYIPDGSLVHYVTESGKHRPAIIVKIESDESVDLCVLLDGEVSDVPSVAYDENGKVSTWHVIERA